MTDDAILRSGVRPLWPPMVDMQAVARSVQFIAKQSTELAEEISKCERGEYSPLMSFERFQQQLDGAFKKFGISAKDACVCNRLGAVNPHRCNQLERIVCAYMADEVGVAA